MGADDGRKGMFGRHHHPVPFLHETEAGQDKIVQRIKYDDYLYGYHDDIQKMFHTRLSLTNSVRSSGIHGRIDQAKNDVQEEWHDEDQMPVYQPEDQGTTEDGNSQG